MTKDALIYCEGQTEERFVKDVLSPYLSNWGIKTTPTICVTNNRLNRRGGVSKYSRMHNEILKMCNYEDVFITTMFDYYGLPKDTPGYTNHEENLEKHVLSIESEVDRDIHRRNFKFNLIVHEFEALLFSDPDSFASYPNAKEKIIQINNQYKNPEFINSSFDTAPSKRIMNIIKSYSKARDGIIIAKQVGIASMMNRCPHFSNWVNTIIRECTTE